MAWLRMVYNGGNPPGRAGNASGVSEGSLSEGTRFVSTPAHRSLSPRWLLQRLVGRYLDRWRVFGLVISTATPPAVVSFQAQFCTLSSPYPGRDKVNVPLRA